MRNRPSILLFSLLASRWRISWRRETRLLSRLILLLVHRLVSVLLAPFGDCRQAPPEPFLHGSHLHYELPSPAACADVREAEEIERGWFLPLHTAQSSPVLRNYCAEL